MVRVQEVTCDKLNLYSDQTTTTNTNKQNKKLYFLQLNMLDKHLSNNILSPCVTS